MPKFDYAKLTLKERQRITEPLVDILFMLKKKDQVRNFLSRLLTPSEFVMLGRRLQVAEGLVQGYSYETIREGTGVGFSTIQSVDSWLEHALQDYHDIKADNRRKAKEEANRKNWKPDYGPRNQVMLGTILFK